ncbi:helix-turn-helix domain-containing protein [Clostridioides sp. ES-S-0145-01]|uniref:phage terminase small subunit n=1 Tax=Clostridioides sp. ES-S-0145-01 TaxID=2770784 RepID=UPI001D102372|nr:helix-turn-helix domain-containing protein [Clostridioides sp. ES-S-0145-01]
MQDVKEKVKQDYLKGMKQKEISAKYDISLNTLKSWIKRYNWASEKKKGAPKSKRGAPLGNKNATGPPGNKNAEKFGFFSKYLPEETQELIQEISIKDKFDILWEQITIQYAAIIRAQKIMYVKDKEEMIKEVKKSKVKTSDRKTEKTSTNSQEEEYEWEFQFAWDRQASFLNAQSRAMSELRSLIKQYDEMIHKDWNLATEEQKNRVEKLKCEVRELNRTDDENDELKIVIDYGDSNDN